MSSSVSPPSYIVYMLRCADGSLYTGLTTDLARRLAEHQQGAPKGARYTRSRRPVQLAWQSEPLPDRAAAASLEWQLKRLSRSAKERWLQVPNQPVAGAGPRPGLRPPAAP